MFGGGRATQKQVPRAFAQKVQSQILKGSLTAPDDQHPRRRLFVFNDVLIDIVAPCAFERAQIVARLGWLEAGKCHFRAALRAWRLHQAITK
jgi:hypothetical protein